MTCLGHIQRADVHQVVPDRNILDTRECLTRDRRTADTAAVKVIYVETCPRCDCALVRTPDGETPSSARLKATCAGCSCHDSYPIAAGS